VLNTAGTFLSKSPQRSDVSSVFAGLRPLAATDNDSAKTKEISRSHKIIISESGLVSVIGGKWTTYRKMAEDAMDNIFSDGLLPTEKGSTENLKIHGYTVNVDENRLAIYGSDKKEIEKLEKQNQYYSQTLSEETPITVAQVIWAVRNEMARTVEDFLARRTRVLFTDAKLAVDLAPKVADIMMRELGQNEVWKARQLDKFSEVAKNYSLNGLT
jgi:glycerol-3-phosphate dehydrogenase